MKHVWLGMVCLLAVVSVQADGRGDALYNQGVAIYKTDPAQACELFVQAAEAGHPPAMAGAGHCYETGADTATNYAKAIEWYEKAVENNSIKASEGLARIYASALDHEFHDGEKAVIYASAVVRKKPRDAQNHSCGTDGCFSGRTCTLALGLSCRHARGHPDQLRAGIPVGGTVLRILNLFAAGSR